MHCQDQRDVLAFATPMVLEGPGVLRLLTVWSVLSLSVPALAEDTPKRLTANDLSVETHKWDGKTIQATMQCFYADKDEFRCIVGASGRTGVRVDFQDIEPPSMKKAIEDKCDTVEKAASRLCRVQATFVYLGNNREEKSDGMVLMSIVPEDGKATFAPAK
jgi:hypothetical protein